MNSKVDRNGLAARIAEHRRHHNDSDTGNLLWSGYLAALMEYGYLTPDDYHELRASLRNDGGQERRDLFLGFYTGQ